MAKRHNLGKRVYWKHGAWYYVDHRRRWHRLGATEAKAHAALAELFAEESDRMSAVLARYEREVLAGKAEATQQMQRRQLASINRTFGNMKPGAIAAWMVDKHHKLAAQRSVVQANRELSLLRHVFRKAEVWGYPNTNPARTVELLPEKPRDRYVSDDEVELVARHAGQRYPYIPLVMQVMMITGQDKRTVALLERSQLIDEGIEFTRSKTGGRLIVEWTPALRAAIDAAKGQHGKVVRPTVFVNARGEPLTLSGFDTAWGKVMRSLVSKGLLSSPFRPHDLRAKTYSDTGNYHLLGHSTKRTADRHYQRRPVRVKPGKLDSVRQSGDDGSVSS